MAFALENRFRKVMKFLMTRYSQSGNSSSVPGMVLPDTLAEFREKYVLSFSHANLRQRRPIMEINNVVDIRCSAVYNVIHSALCTEHDKAGWDIQLHRIYQQYPDILLRSTLTKMKNDMMISQKKKNSSKSVPIFIFIIFFQTKSQH